MVLYPLPPIQRLVSETIPTKTTLLFDYDAFCAVIDSATPVCLTCALDIPPTAIPSYKASLQEQFSHLCKDPLDGTLPPFHHI